MAYTYTLSSEASLILNMPGRLKFWNELKLSIWSAIPVQNVPETPRTVLNISIVQLHSLILFTTSYLITMNVISPPTTMWVKMSGVVGISACWFQKMMKQKHLCLWGIFIYFLKLCIHTTSHSTLNTLYLLGSSAIHLSNRYTKQEIYCIYTHRDTHANSQTDRKKERFLSLLVVR